MIEETFKRFSLSPFFPPEGINNVHEISVDAEEKDSFCRI